MYGHSMTNAEQTLRLLRELEQIDLDQIGTAESDSASASFTPAQLLKALIKTNFVITDAVVEIHDDA